MSRTLIFQIAIFILLSSCHNGQSLNSQKDSTVDSSAIAKHHPYASRVFFSFINDERTFRKSTEIMEAQNEMTYENFMKAKMDKGTVAFPFYDKAFSIKKSSDELCHYIEGIKSLLKAQVMNISTKSADTLDIVLLNDFDKRDIIDSIMIGPDPKIITGKSKELMRRIDMYHDSLLNYFDQPIRKEMEKSFSLVECFNIYSESDNKMISWEWLNFYQEPIVAVIARLSAFQSNVRLAEGIAIRELYNEIPVK